MRDFDDTEFEPLGIVLYVPAKQRKKLRDGSMSKPSAGGANRGRTRGGRERIARIAKRTPEVMVKITGGTRGFMRMREHLNYITRNGTLVAETPNGEIYGLKEVNATAMQWWQNRGQAQEKRRANTRETVNLILSMPAGTDREKFVAACRLFADRTFAANHDYLFVEHRDTEHPHVHLTIRSLGDDMQRLSRKKPDLQAWREGLALELRAQGITAEASPRRTRGVVMRSKKQAIHHLDLRQASRVQRLKIAEAVREITKKVDAGKRPWEPATKATQARVRSAWQQIAGQFEAEGGEGIELAKSIRTFVAAMPAVKTEREVIMEEVAKALPAPTPRKQGGGEERASPQGRGDEDRER